MSIISCNKRLFLFLRGIVTLTLLLGLINSDAKAQFSNNLPLCDFFDKAGNPLVTGRIISITRKNIEVLNGLDKRFVLDINNLSKINLEFIKQVKRSYELYEKRKNECDNFIKKIHKNSTDSQIKRALKKLAECGLAVEDHHNWAAGVLVNSETLSTRAAALEAFLATCPKTEKSYQFLKHRLAVDPDLSVAFEAAPFSLISKIGAYGNISIPFLTNAVNTGEIRFDFSKIPVQMKQIYLRRKSHKFQIHLAAITALCNINNTESNDSIFAAISFAERPINGLIDHATIFAAYSTFAKNGARLSGRHSDFKNKYDTVFPKESKAWLQNARGIGSPNRHIAHRSKMRRFSDRSGNFLVFADIETVSDGQVVLTNHLMQRISVPLAKFSDSDQVWLEQNATR
ncbi:SHD1 domain-containing protein [bacterium]|nr:SHD1 domain-containing protein [bacterium]